jgi:hypothetical protein
MKLNRSLCALALSVSLMLASAHTARAQSDTSPAVTPKEKIELFDGRSLTGWKCVSRDPAADPAAIWSVKEGVIHCAGKPNGYARTVGVYRDYTLHLEWRFPAAAGNSGAFVHLSGPDKIWPVCLEVQLKSGDAGSVRVNGGALVREVDLTAKDPKNVALRAPGAEKPIGEWNRVEIVCRGETMSVKVNGVLQNEVTGASVSAGAIALQAEGAPVEFRKIAISPLP